MVIRSRAGKQTRCRSLLGALLFLATFSCDAQSAATDCIHEAAHCFQVNPLVIKAIIWQESGGRKDALNQNTNLTQDVGLMQINSLHFAALKRLGVSAQELRENSCVNVFSGTYLLRQAIQQYGYSWDGIGYYHSKTPSHHSRYVNQLLRALRNEIRNIEAIQVVRSPGDTVSARFMPFCAAARRG